MADRNAVAIRPIWARQAEEAKLKSEAEKTAAAKAAFEATFKDVDKSKPKALDLSSDSEDEAEDLVNKPIGPVDPSKCTAAGAGVSGGSAGSPCTFNLITKDSDGRKIPKGDAQVKVKVTPGVGVGGSDIDGIVKDLGDGTYTVTYAVPKRGNYMVHVECNGRPIMGSPFPVFFSAGSSNGGLLGVAPTVSYPNLVNANMPNMPNYAGSVSGAFPGLVGMIPGLVPGPSGGVILPGIGASLGEVCREFLNGRCFKTDCKFTHPTHNLLMSAIAATSTMGTMSQVPMAPSAAAMAAAQAIMAAQALQAHTAQLQAQSKLSKDSSSACEADNKADVLKKTVQISNLNPLLTAEHLKQLFAFCGTVVDCTITDSKHFAYIEYAKAEEATAALALNNMDVCGRPLNVEMAKSLPQKPAGSSASSLPIMMQQAVAMQQMQFQQALLMQQTMTAQQAASRAATVKSATDLASARAAEISKKLRADGFVIDEKEPEKKSSYGKRRRSRSFSPARHFRGRRSKSPRRSRHRSRSFSPQIRHSRDHRSRSPVRYRHYTGYEYDRRSYRDVSDRSGRRDSKGSRDYHVSDFKRNKSRSPSPRGRRSYRDRSDSPKPRHCRSSGHRSKSPGLHQGGRSSPANDADRKLKQHRRSRSKSVEDRHKSSKRIDEGKEKAKYRGRRRSRSASSENKHDKSGKLSPQSSDENLTTHRKRSKSRSRSRSRSMDTKDHLKVKEGEPVDEKEEPKCREGIRSTSNVKEMCKKTSSQSVDENKSKISRHSTSKSIRDDVERKGIKDEGRKEKRKHRDRRRSRSLSAEHESHTGSKSSRHREDKLKYKHRRRSRSKSPEVKEKRKNSRSINDKLDRNSRKYVKDDGEKSSRNSTDLRDGTSCSNCSGKNHSIIESERSECDKSKSMKAAIYESESDRSDVAENSKSQSNCDPETFAENNNIGAEPDYSFEREGEI
uniref:RNA recognition motif (RRM)-containing protein n=1 Tax=Chenopodium quinoa TaxID=63459 RepID=A0A803LTM1_CHEQI